MKKYRPHFLVFCVLALILLTGMHNALQNALTDMRFGWFPRQASGKIVLVAIDPHSIETIGVWPWPRRLHADLIDRLESAGASDIAFDVDFSSPSDPAFDQALVDALQRAGGSVVLPAFTQLVGDSENGKTIFVNRPLPQFGEHAWPAVVNVAVESDGLVRRYSYGEILDGKFLPSMGALLAGKDKSKKEPLQIDFNIRADTLPTVSYVDVLRGDPVALRTLKDKKVVIGATAIELGDRFNVPNGRVIPGPILQMLAAELILQNRMLHTSSNVVTWGGLGIIVFLMVVLWRRLTASLRVAVLVGLAIAAELGAIFLQAQVAHHPRYLALACSHRRLSRCSGTRRDRFSRLIGEDRRKTLSADRHVAWRWFSVRRPERPHHRLEPRGRVDFRLRTRRDDRPAAR